MYAVVDIAGKQVKIQEDARVKVPFLGKDEGEKVTFNRVLLVADEKETKIGKPVLDGASVEATVVKNGREKKIIVFKKIPRKNYNKKNGHRQLFTEIKIEKIAL
ncbi:MAG: 50S ribosomal protein L21 [Calditrichaeota bacterium]|nr:50S ribosomal protein L21 [Calditrichota bacterium]